MTKSQKVPRVKMTKSSKNEATIIHMQDKVVFFVPHRDDTETEKEKWQRMAALMSLENLELTELPEE